MKRMMMTLVLMVTIVASAAAMSFSKARKEALFLSDKMAYELNLSLSQYEAVYEINLDYLLGLDSYADVDGVFWLRRNADLRYVLTPWQWERYTQIVDFYRPMMWISGHHFSLSLRSRYTNKNFFYYERPSIYGSYRGGHNSGRDSYYRDRDFHKPEHQGGPLHYGSSTPAPQGSGRPSGNKNQPSYSIGTPQRGGNGSGVSNGNPVPGSNNNSGSVRGGGRAENGGSRSQGTFDPGTSGTTSRSQGTTNGSSRNSGNTGRSGSTRGNSQRGGR